MLYEVITEPYIRQASVDGGATLEGAPAIRDVPSAGLDKMRDGLDKIRDIGKISEKLKWKSAGEIEKQNLDKEQSTASPQDNYTREDKKKLQDILLSVDKDS